MLNSKEEKNTEPMLNVELVPTLEREKKESMRSLRLERRRGDSMLNVKCCRV